MASTWKPHARHSREPIHGPDESGARTPAGGAADTADTGISTDAGSAAHTGRTEHTAHTRRTGHTKGTGHTGTTITCAAPDVTGLPTRVLTKIDEAQARARRNWHRRLSQSGPTRMTEARRDPTARNAQSPTARKTQGTGTADDWHTRLAAGSPAQRLGRAGEHQAANFLRAQGLQVLACNLYCRMGEIDLVARDGRTLVFVEVRQLRQKQTIRAAATIGVRKQQRLVRAARYFLGPLTRQHFHGCQPPCRFDVISLEAGRLTWLQHAFDGLSLAN